MNNLDMNCVNLLVPLILEEDKSATDKKGITDIFVFKFFSFRNKCLQMFAIKTQHKKNTITDI